MKILRTLIKTKETIIIFRFENFIKPIYVLIPGNNIIFKLELIYFLRTPLTSAACLLQVWEISLTFPPVPISTTEGPPLA